MKNLPRLIYFVSFLTGCAAILGVPDLEFDPNSPQSDPDAAAADGNSTGPSTDGGGEAGPPCDETKLQTDPNHCGRCGHSCLGTECKAGKCEPIQLGAIPNASLGNIVEHGSGLYVGTVTINTVAEERGIWKLGKVPGNPVKYVDIANARTMKIVGDTLYFISYDYAFDDAGQTGGLYSCDLTGPTPCKPKLLAKAESPFTMTLDKTSLVYTDTNLGIMKYTPPGPNPVVFRAGYGPSNIWVDGEAVYYLVTPGTMTSDGAILWNLYQDAGDATEVSRWNFQDGVSANLTGGPNALYFTAYNDGNKDAPTGIVRRVSRPDSAGTTPCDYAALTNKRPVGLYIDATRIYWTNQGNSTAPYANGSVAYCPLEGCCIEATTHWTGEGEPYAITGDADGLYWVTYRNGGIWKVAKP